MELNRRQFLTLVGGSAAGAVLFQACGVPEEEQLVQASLEMPEDLVTGLDNWYATVCRQCPTAEGIVVRVMEGRAKKIEGNVNYPINVGKHSVRCEAGLQALYHPDRIAGPQARVGQRGSGRWQELSWTDAVARMVHQLQELKNINDGAGMAMVTDPVGAHLGAVVERFVSRFGGRHVRFEPLERTNLRRAVKDVFQQDAVPDFDVANADYILSFGADWLGTWVSPVRYATGYGNFRQGRSQRGTLVHVSSHFSMTAANADEWIYVNPGQEGLLALSIAQAVIDSEHPVDAAVVSALTGGNDLSAYRPENVADATGVAAKRIRAIADEFAGHERSLAIGGGSTAAHTNGLENLSAVLSLNYLAGNVGRAGGIVLNPTADLAGVRSTAEVSSFADVQSLIADMNRGRVKVLMIRGADPLYGLPDGAGFARAAENVPFIFSFSGHMDDTTAMADLVLPEHNYLEDWGSDVPDPGPGHQVFGFQQPVVRSFFEPRGVHLGTKGFADVLLVTADLLELDLGLPGDNFRDFLMDGAKKLFDSGRGAPQTADFGTFWNTLLQRGGWWDRAATYSGPAPTPRPLPSVGAPAFEGPVGDRTFHLVPFASLSMTDGRGAHLPWLQATPDPVTTATWLTWVEINTKVASEMDITEGDVIEVTSSTGSIEALGYPHPAVSPDVVGIPFGQGHTSGGRYSEGRGANVTDILATIKDKDTGALAWAATRVRIKKTGRWIRLPRFENTAPDLAVDEDQRIVELTPADSRET